MLVRLDPAIDPAAVASLSDNVPDAWRTVGPPLAEAPGAEVLIVGGAGGSVPLYAIQLALALGAPAVHYLDNDQDSLAIAAGLGAMVVEGPIPRQLGPFPVTVDSSMSTDGLGCALRSTGPDGVCTSTGIYLKDTAVPLFDMYVKGVTFRTGRGHARPAIPRLLELVAEGRFQPQLVTSRVTDWESAAEALSDPPRKLVLARGPGLTILICGGCGPDAAPADPAGYGVDAAFMQLKRHERGIHAISPRRQPPLAAGSPASAALSAGLWRPTRRRRRRPPVRLPAARWWLRGQGPQYSLNRQWKLPGCSWRRLAMVSW